MHLAGKKQATSPVSPLYLPYISLYLPYISLHLAGKKQATPHFESLPHTPPPTPTPSPTPSPSPTPTPTPKQATPHFESLQAFWPALQVLAGDVDEGAESFAAFYEIWRRYRVPTPTLPLTQLEVNIYLAWRLAWVGLGFTLG